MTGTDWMDGYVVQRLAVKVALALYWTGMACGAALASLAWWLS